MIIGKVSFSRNRDTVLLEGFSIQKRLNGFPSWNRLLTDWDSRGIFVRQFQSHLSVGLPTTYCI